MASLTKKTKAIRANKKKKAGSTRKKKMENQGSTPKFAVHPSGKPSAS
ncbi:MAG: hypothetical protein GY898_02820 [Proteobacteria bacterium]|nr:hypothetical protein [Pseudomonadota bacterium]